MSDTADPTVQEDTKVKLSRPKRYNVILLNDDYTPMDFVVSILMEIFDRNLDDAYNIMSEVHVNGRGIANTYSYEVANMKSDEAMSIARGYNHPLKCTIEEVPTEE